MEYGSDTAMLLYRPCYVAMARLFFKRVRRANAVLANCTAAARALKQATDCIMYSCGLQLTKTKNDHDNTK